MKKRLSAIVFCFVLSAGGAAMAAENTSFKNPLFNSGLYSPQYFSMPHIYKYRVKLSPGDWQVFWRDYKGVWDEKNPRAKDCKLLEDRGSKLLYSCQKDKYIDQENPEGRKNIGLISIGKDKKGYCQVQQVDYSSKQEVVRSVILTSKSKNCGAVAKPEEVKLHWEYPSAEVSDKFVNPLFGKDLNIISRTWTSSKLSPTKIKALHYGNEKDCHLIENEYLGIAYECNGADNQANGEPKKEFYRYGFYYDADWDEYNVKEAQYVSYSWYQAKEGNRTFYYLDKNKIPAAELAALREALEKHPEENKLGF